MKTKKKIVLLAAITTGLFIAAGSAVAIKTLQGEDTDSMQLKSLTVEAFENQKWEGKADPGGAQSTVETKLVGDGNKRCVSRNLAFEKGNVKCLGVRFSFVYPGNNSVTLIPPQKQKRNTLYLDDKNQRIQTEIQGVMLPGKVDAVSIWVLGRGNEYNLEGWIEDWKGDTHIYNFGSLDFIGWRPLTIKIPTNVPQDVESYPQTKNLVFKQFVIRSTARTSNERVVVFFDSLKVLTSVFDLYFDGADMDFDKEDADEKAKMKQYEAQLRKQSQGGGGGGQ